MTRGHWFSIVEDGNGDGVRTADIKQQIDRVIEAPYSCPTSFQARR